MSREYTFRGAGFLARVDQIKADLDQAIEEAIDHGAPEKFVERIVKRKLATRRSRRRT